MTTVATYPDMLPPSRFIGERNRSSALSCFLWCVYFLSTPFYVLPSGLPQPADCVVVLLVAVAAGAGGLCIPRRTGPVIATFAILVLYAMALGCVHTLISRDDGMLMPGAYFLFNLCACVLFAAQLQQGALAGARWMTGALVVSLSIQAVLAAATTGSGMRAVNFFNNPNQLGFYAILYGSLYWVLSHYAAFPRTSSVALNVWTYAAVAYLSASSLSRSAICASGILILLAMLQTKRSRALLLVGVCAIAVPYLSAAALMGVGDTKKALYKDWQVAASLRSRFQKDEVGAQQVSTRGYDRILHHGEYLAFGAGEGALYRFQSGETLEMHSSLGTLLFSYGIVGLLLFARMLWLIARGAGAKPLLFLVPALSYSLAHNGLRQTEFWLLIVLVASLPPRNPLRARKRRAPLRAGLPLDQLRGCLT